MTTLEKVLLRLSQTLSDKGIPYMIIGGMANAVRGEPRATLDIDATVWLSDDQISETILMLERVFQPLVSHPRQFIRDTNARGITLRRINSLDVTSLDPRIGQIASSLDRSDILSNWEAWKRGKENMQEWGQRS